MCKSKLEGGLGFRHLSLFNQALVAKQGWRLISNLSSFIARVLGAKYYRSSSVLDVYAGNNASFVWRSICWGMDLIKQGVRWKVGDGSHILAFEDPSPIFFQTGDWSTSRFISLACLAFH